MKPGSKPPGRECRKRGPWLTPPDRKETVARNLAANVAAAEEEAESAASASRALEPEHAEIGRALASAEQRLAEANEARETAEMALQTAQRARQRTETAAELRVLDAKFEKAELLDREIDLQRQALSGPIPSTTTFWPGCVSCRPSKRG